MRSKLRNDYPDSSLLVLVLDNVFLTVQYFQNVFVIKLLLNGDFLSELVTNANPVGLLLLFQLENFKCAELFVIASLSKFDDCAGSLAKSAFQVVLSD